MSRRIYAVAATITIIVGFSILMRRFALPADEAPSPIVPRGSVLPTPDPVVPKQIRDPNALTWCRDSDGPTNEVRPGLRVSASWALETAVASGLGKRLSHRDAGVAADPMVTCPDLAGCDGYCFYWFEFVALERGVITPVGHVGVDAKTGEVGAHIDGTWTLVPSPRALP